VWDPAKGAIEPPVRVQNARAAVHIRGSSVFFCNSRKRNTFTFERAAAKCVVWRVLGRISRNRSWR